jgi:hypothetical protein
MLRKRACNATILPAVFGVRGKLVIAHLVESGELTLEDVQEAEKAQ